MYIKDITEVIDGLGKITNLEILDHGNVKIYFHKNSTLELIPKIDLQTNEISYAIDYLSGKQNKEIDKLLSKKFEIEEKILSIKNSNEKEEVKVIEDIIEEDPFGIEEDPFFDFE